MAAPNEISPAQLNRLIGTPGCPVLIDICIDEDFDADPRFVPGAFRHPHNAISELLQELESQKTVVICQKGKKLSQGASALLRSHGIDAQFLDGGNYGWRDAGLPVVPAASLPPRQNDGGTLWVTRHRPKIDRIACPWLIRRFVDRKSRFLFVAPTEVEAVAERFGATPFDIGDLFWSHRGDRCTFDTMLEEFALKTEPLERMATIIRGADTNRHDLAPQSAGLLALSVGLSRQHKDDLAQLEAGMLLYDALYRWARDGHEEGHDWPGPGGV